MTEHESFKKTIRARMAKTGEKYGAARRALIDKADRAATVAPAQPAEVVDPPPWIEQPEMSNCAVFEGTGHGWDTWGARIDSWPERSQGHAAIAARLARDEVESQWWAQSITVGYERIRGLRTRYMRADGTFAGSATRTITIDGDRLRADLCEPERQQAIISQVWSKQPALVELRSRSTSKSIRWKIHPDQGSARFSITSTSDGRCRVSIQHSGLGSTDAVDEWKSAWVGWLDSLGTLSADPAAKPDTC